MNLCKTTPSFTCVDKYDDVTTWPCTGSTHTGPTEVMCVCSCHTDPARNLPKPAEVNARKVAASQSAAWQRLTGGDDA